LLLSNDIIYKKKIATVEFNKNFDKKQLSQFLKIKRSMKLFDPWARQSYNPVTFPPKDRDRSFERHDSFVNYFSQEFSVLKGPFNFMTVLLRFRAKKTLKNACERMGRKWRGVRKNDHDIETGGDWVITVTQQKAYFTV
jgi:hypothetical protein